MKCLSSQIGLIHSLEKQSPWKHLNVLMLPTLSILISGYCVLHVLRVSKDFSVDCRWIGYANYATTLGVTECVHDALRWTGVLSRVYSHLTLRHHNVHLAKALFDSQVLP